MYLLLNMNQTKITPNLMTMPYFMMESTLRRNKGLLSSNTKIHFNSVNGSSFFSFLLGTCFLQKATQEVPSALYYFCNMQEGTKRNWEPQKFILTRHAWHENRLLHLKCWYYFKSREYIKRKCCVGEDNTERDCLLCSLGYNGYKFLNLPKIK